MREHLNLWPPLAFLVGLSIPEAQVPWVALGIVSVIGFLALRFVRRSWRGYGLIPILALWVGGCAASNRAMIFTEEGLRSAEQGWDGHYNAEGDRCESLHEPKTPAMEACFGATYDIDAVVATVVQSSVALLQTYWRRRAAGEKPDLKQVLREIAALIDDLPPQAKQYFDRVRGIP